MSEIRRAKAPLIVGIPHTGLDLAGMKARFNPPSEVQIKS
jgi:hypothetical protein